uniref:MAM domain-containing protein n=1 Tax=Steinernema glaseri TaxID=37863 RepID=A0A1I7ZWJ7_9BILA
MGLFLFLELTLFAQGVLNRLCARHEFMQHSSDRHRSLWRGCRLIQHVSTTVLPLVNMKSADRSSWVLYVLVLAAYLKDALNQAGIALLMLKLATLIHMTSLHILLIVNQYIIVAKHQWSLAFLGSRVTAKAYSSGGKGSFISKDLDLLCQDFKSCQWQNDENDQMDWVLGEGSVDAGKLKIITGSNLTPGRDFFILASDPRAAEDSGVLISDPISCQKDVGVLTLEMWRSRARVVGQEPDLEICIRKVGSNVLEQCQTVEPDENNLVRTHIPPTEEPFNIAIKGHGFENSPEGGLIIIDHISYAASVENIANCDGGLESVVPLTSNDLDNGIVLDSADYHSADGSPNVYETLMLIDGDSDIEQQSTKIMRGVKQESEEIPRSPSKKQESLDNNLLTYESCLLLKCTSDEMSIGTPCGYTPAGDGAAGGGLNGWKVVNVTTNNANRLTGVHGIPPNGDQNVIVATFPSRSARRFLGINRFVLESPYLEFSPNVDVYLGFWRYIAVHGIEIAVCSDGEAIDCFYQYPPRDLPYAMKSRSWHFENVQLPTHVNKLFIVAQSTTKDRQNAGQIGIADLRLFYDEKAGQSVC